MAGHLTRIDGAEDSLLSVQNFLLSEDKKSIRLRDGIELIYFVHAWFCLRRRSVIVQFLLPLFFIY